MSRMIDCQKLGKPAEGLLRPPYPGELGKRIYDQISQVAWQQWLTHQTMLINEYRLDMSDKGARDFLKQEMEKFLFAGIEVKPGDYTPPDNHEQ